MILSLFLMVLCNSVVEPQVSWSMLGWSAYLRSCQG